MYRKMVVVAVTAALAAVSLVACGSSSSGTSPQDVQSALKATANQSGLQLTLTLQGTMSDFSGGGNSGLTQAQEQAILDSRVVMTVNAAQGTSLDNAGNGGELAFALDKGGDTLVQLRQVGTTLYAQVDYQQLTTDYGLDKGKVAQFQSELTQLGSQVNGLKALADGQWVSLDVSLVSQFTQTIGVTLPSVPQLAARITGAFFNTLAQGTNVTSQGSGKAQLTVNAQSLVTALAQAVAGTPNTSSVDKQVNGLAQRAQAAVPSNKSANVIVTVSGGIASNVELSLNQFDTSKQLTGPVNLNMAVAKSSSVSAPSGAVAINIPQAIKALEGSSTGSSSSSTGSASG